MTKNDRYTCGLQICKLYDWAICSPFSEVVIKFASDGGRRRQWCVQIPQLRRGELVTAAARRLQGQLAKVMYPVLTNYHLWVETPDGNPIPVQRTTTPDFPEATAIEHKEWGESGREIIWFARESTQTHRIDFGPIGGRPIIMPVPVDLWPPTLFLVGNNQIHAIKIEKIDKAALRDAGMRLATLGDLLSMHQGSFYFMTGSDRPPGPPTP